MLCETRFALLLATALVAAPLAALAELAAPAEPEPEVSEPAEPEPEPVATEPPPEETAEPTAPTEPADPAEPAEPSAPDAPAASAPPETHHRDKTPGAPDSEDDNTGLIVGIAIGGVGLFLALVAAIVVCVVCRRRQRGRSGDTARLAEMAHQYHAESTAHSIASTAKRSHAGGAPSGGYGGPASAAAFSTSTTGSFAPPALEAPPRVDPTVDATTLGTLVAYRPLTMAQTDSKAQLAVALENMATAEPPELFDGRFLLMNERVEGGQALVNFAREASGSFAQYAVKFFFKKADFDAETALYSHSELRRTLPTAIKANGNEGGALRSRGGLAFPPYLVLSRGMTLLTWNSEERGFGAVMSMFESLVELLAVLHAAGYVHRDLKPDNILLLLDSQRWRLLDYGIMAAAGNTTFPCCTILYAPPEVVAAYDARGQIEVRAAHDVWSLGVMVYETITRAPAFARRGLKMATVFACARGEEAYAWERPMDEQPPAWRNSRLRDAVLSCLARDPAERPSAEELKTSIWRMGSRTLQRD